ncbi:transposase IS4 family protein [Natrialba asiatica DSM 12278]|uniref:Transposase IS4 family protein n=1 Tax=Natrialba asiatica (strain ATCC 700177 / DSM 12278 / JCM 9576 / FERM P-10747 / NBRC 102637 / 172P1) TaxID=29540 RepID=M0B3Z8_NATA1|nr:transposase IS4 family protein [Natrialba asiatica DSM 12278]
MSPADRCGGTSGTSARCTPDSRTQLGYPLSSFCPRYALGIGRTPTSDKGYDWDDLREELREADVRPVIKHRGFSPLDMAHNARHDDDTYHRRSIVEAVFFALKQRYGDTLRVRT